jgi:prolyl oligopeptidase
MTSVAALRQNSPEALAWQTEQDKHTQERLHGLADYQRFVSTIAELEEPRRVSLPQCRGGQWFQTLDPDAGADQPVLVVSDRPGAPGRVLVDPSALSAASGAAVGLMSWAVSKSGRFLAYFLQTGGREVYEAHVLDVATGKDLGEQLPFSVMNMRWVDDESGIWLTTRELNDPGYSQQIRFHRLGGEAAKPEAIPGELVFPNPVPSPDGKWVVAVTGNVEIRADYVRGPDGAWRPFLANVSGGTFGCIAKDAWIAIVDGENPHGRLVRIPFATSEDASTWVELAPASSDVLTHVALFGPDLLAVSYLRDGASGLRVLRLDGTLVEEVALPGLGIVTTYPASMSTKLLPAVTTDEGGFSFLFTTFAQSFGAYRWAPAEGLTTLIAPVKQADDISVELIVATSADGAKVPAHVVRRADLVGKPLPTLVYGYGGFNCGLLPGYDAHALAWVQAGGAYVLTHLRGGNEYGRTWWSQGRMGQKQNCFNDLYAIGEELRRRRIASALAIHGASNGGVLTAAAYAQRPDLWDAVVSEVPVTDLLDIEGEAQLAAIAATEYGSPLVPEQRAWLAAYSPLQNLKHGAHPALLVISGENDPRCPPRHGRQFVARARELNTSGAETLLRIPTGQGHGAQLRSAQTRQHAEILAFCAAHTGLQ